MLNFKRLLHHTLPAFSLIEMSLVLAIMGTIAGLAMPLLLDQKTTQKQQHTNLKMEVVLTALGTYAATYKHLPCPASKTSHGKPLQCAKDSTSQAVGYIPYQALGLQKQSTQDGFGHPLRYALDPSLAQPIHFLSNQTGTLAIVNEQGQTVANPTTHTDRLAVILISEGTAYQHPQSEFERTNTNNTLSFVDATFSNIKDNPFRHKVRWSTRNNLLTYYGKSAPIKPKAKETPAPQKTPTANMSAHQAPAPQDLPQNLDAEAGF